MDVKKVGKELGVDFVVEGSVLRRLGGRIRITAQLINAANGAMSGQSDTTGPLTKSFELQDEVVSAIAATARGASQARWPIMRIQGGARTLLPMKRYCRRGNCWRHTKRKLQSRLLRKALIVDPNYAQAYAWLSWIHMIEFFYDLSAETIKEAASLGRKAVRR